MHNTSYISICQINDPHAWLSELVYKQEEINIAIQQLGLLAV